MSNPFVQGNAPEEPIKETWTWYTDTMVSDNGTEQRIGLRNYPRRKFVETIAFDTEAQLREQFRLMFAKYKGGFYLPLWQYATKVNAAVAAAASTIYIDIDRTEIRQDGYIIIYENEVYDLLQVDTISGDHFTTATGAVNAFTSKAKVMPCVLVAAGNNAALSRLNVNNSGQIQLTALELAPQDPFVRESNDATLLTFGGLPVLQYTPIGTTYDQAFDTAIEMIDFDLGNIDVRNDWVHSQVQFTLNFLMQRVGAAGCARFDYWKVFGEALNGSTNPFFISSNRSDFDIITPVAGAGTLVTVRGHDYVNDFFPYAAFKQVVVTSKAGTHYATVTGVANVGGNDRLTLNPALPAGADWATDQELSFLLKVRLVDSAFEFNHYGTYSLIKLNIRTAD